MKSRRWINTFLSLLFDRSVRGQKPMPPRNRCRLSLERLEDRLPPAAGLTSGNEELLSAYGQLPLRFEANQGQTAAEVHYLTQGSGYTLFLTSGGAVISLAKPASVDTAIDASTTGVVLSLNLIGANPQAKVTGLDVLPGSSNYFVGNDSSQWHTGITNYSKVQYQDVYPGTNLVYYGNQQQLEYDFHLAPGADPSRIRFAVDGADTVKLDDKGNLVLHTAAGDLLQHAPVLYQQVAGERQPVSGQFVLFGDNEVGFQVGAYDATLPLVIDPVLSYSTYLGGHHHDEAYGIAVDGSGNAYITGRTWSTDFPPTIGAFQTSHASDGDHEDVFVSKLNATGTALIYSTYLGGNGHQDRGFGIAVDGWGNAYITGSTDSTNFPTTTGAFQTSYGGGADDVFMTKLNATGTALVYSTYLGGNSDDGASSIAVDGSGNAYVTGVTKSTNFSTTSGAFQISLVSQNDTYDAFVTKLNSSGAALVYSTLLGGDNGDDGAGIAVDACGNAYVTGLSYSNNFPTTSGALQTSRAPGTGANADVIVTKLNATGTALIYSTYLGGNNYDFGYGIALDGLGNAYVTGTTFSTNFPTTVGAFQTNYAGGGSNGDFGGDAFVTKLNASGTALVYSTYLGGNSPDVAWGIVVDASGNAYVTGNTDSTNGTNFPTTSGAFQASFGGGRHDAFLTKLNSSGTALGYSTFFGGNTNGFFAQSGIDVGFAIALDGWGNVYVAGYTSSANFPITTGAVQTSYSTAGETNDDFYNDAFVAKFAFGAPPATTVNLSGRVFDDRNNDGVFNGSDIGLPCVALQLFNENDLVNPIAGTTTGSDGSYALGANLQPGAYRIVETQPAGLLDGKETAGSLGGMVDNTQDSNVIRCIVIHDYDSAGTGYNFAELRPSSIQGLVWLDFNNDGEVDFGEQAIANVTIHLTGIDDRGAAVNLSMPTDTQGIFEFTNLRPSNAAGYTITEDQPSGYLDGIERLGTVNDAPSGTASDNVFSQLAMQLPNASAINYNFAERPLAGGAASSGQTATIGFWQNNNGQNLIKALNGDSASTQLANWLAATLPNMYGANAGANNLTGKTNAQVAAFYVTLFKRTGATNGPPKMDAQVLATALAVYATNQTLAGNTAAAYGFQVTQYGVGNATFDVGDANRAAFGLSATQSTVMTLLDILLATNTQARNGLLYDVDGSGTISSTERTLRELANNVYSDINELGGM